ncbi:MAG: hypothetical protein LBE37_11465 [Sphingobacterium sp.]|jgi:hypothetical protein|nr:hypothetical protein [Sphingobacterium sp.]
MKIIEMGHFAQIVKKLKLFIVLTLLGIISRAEAKVFLIGGEGAELNRFDVKQYCLNTNSIYNFSFDIELYNIIPKISEKLKLNNQGMEIILFSILPDVKTGGLWEEVSLGTITKERMSFRELNDLKEHVLGMRFDKGIPSTTKFFNEHKLAVFRDGKYYVAKKCLLQFFAVRNRPFPFPNIYGTINLQQPFFSVKDMYNLYKGQYGGLADFPLESYLSQSSFDYVRDRMEYQSRKFAIQGKEAYQYWTYTDWHENKIGYELERGIDRFVYIPDSGIVGGSFDFYFYFHRKEIGLDLVRFIKNIKEEGVILPTSL